jgi:anti-sigma regulatory factor (Ser/Thr protein kinase)
MTSTLVVHCPASPARVKSLRHALRSFLAVFEVDPIWLDDVLTAVGEALINVVEHAYDGDGAARGGDDPNLEMTVRVGDDRLTVEVADTGVFIEREPRVGRGFGLRIARAIALDVAIDTSDGTRVCLTFGRNQQDAAATA